MKIGKYVFILGAVIMLSLTPISSTADTISDPTDDVYHHTWTNNVESYVVSTSDKPNIDITELTYTVEGSTLTVNMKVDGAFQTSNLYVYSIVYNSSDGIYSFTYALGIATAIGMTDGGIVQGTASVNGDTFTGTIEIDETGTMSSIVGIAYEYLVDYTTVIDPTTYDFYLDYVPGTLAPWYTGDDDTGDDDTGDDDTGDDDTGDDDTETDDGDDNGTPGFELLAVIAALAIALIILKRRK